jgi:hypothetical protein
MNSIIEILQAIPRNDFGIIIIFVINVLVSKYIVMNSDRSNQLMICLIGLDVLVLLIILLSFHYHQDMANGPSGNKKHEISHDYFKAV